MWPLSSIVRRSVLRWSEASPFSASRDSLAARHPARPRCVGPRRKSDGLQSSRCEFLVGAGTQNPPLALPARVRSGKFPPNDSFKRTVQSLRDWSCRLTQTLGGRFYGGLRRVRSQQAETLSPRDIRPARADLLRVASPMGRKVAGVSSSEARAPTTAIRPCLLGRAPAHFRLTTHSSGPINRFAIDVAA